MRSIILTLITVWLIACSPHHIEYMKLSPKPIFNKELAKQILLKTLDESKHEYFSSYLGASIENNKYIINGQLSRQSFSTGGVAIQDKRTAIYFSSIESVKVDKRKNSVAVVSVLVNGKIFSKFVTNYDGASNFIQAIESLKYYSELQQ